MENLVEFLKSFFESQSSPIMQAFYAGLFTWILTAIPLDVHDLPTDALPCCCSSTVGDPDGVQQQWTPWPPSRRRYCTIGIPTRYGSLLGA